jgi:hypothetical protein
MIRSVLSCFLTCDGLSPCFSQSCLAAMLELPEADQWVVFTLALFRAKC